MSYQMTFKRYELKYLLDLEKKAAVLSAMKDYMKLDDYGRTTIRNIYFDTNTFRLIRRSLEHPAYKEKLRIRSYKNASETDSVFVELKKKYKSVVYKRRLVLPQKTALYCLVNGIHFPVDTQISNEIHYFCMYYRSLNPTVFLSYEREAYYSLDGSDFRVTFDENILFRQNDFSLDSDIYGSPLLQPGQTLMEIKTSGGIPLWMTHCLTEYGIFKTSYSKYGNAYKQIWENQCQGGILHA